MESRPIDIEDRDPVEGSSDSKSPQWAQQGLEGMSALQAVALPLQYV
jgi:hypothetical protein